MLQIVDVDEWQFTACRISRLGSDAPEASKGMTVFGSGFQIFKGRDGFKFQFVSVLSLSQHFALSCRHIRQQRPSTEGQWGAPRVDVSARSSHARIKRKDFSPSSLFTPDVLPKSAHPEPLNALVSLKGSTNTLRLI